jgi:hypothetical protein
LVECIAQIKDFRPVAFLTWTVGTRVKHPQESEWRTLDPHWGLGFYDAADMPPSLTVQEVDGILFGFGARSDHLLDGGTLHYTDGSFHVEKSAI